MSCVSISSHQQIYVGDLESIARSVSCKQCHSALTRLLHLYNSLKPVFPFYSELFVSVSLLVHCLQYLREDMMQMLVLLCLAMLVVLCDHFFFSSLPSAWLYGSKEEARFLELLVDTSANLVALHVLPCVLLTVSAS